MYRQSDHATQPPTVIEYRSHWVRPGYLILGLCVLAFSIGMVMGLHATRLTCARSSADDSGMCRVHRYAFFGSFDLQLPADEIAAFDVQIRSGSKGGKHAELALRMKQSSLPNVDLESGPWGQIDPTRADMLRRRFDDWLSRGGPSFDEWLTRGPASNIFLTIFSLAFGVIGVTMLREQLGQLRRIRVVVDHTRKIVSVRGQDIPWSEIEDVSLDLGRALFWSSGKNEHVPGHRLLIERRVGKSVLVTRDFRAGHVAGHEQARRKILNALGRATS